MKRSLALLAAIAPLLVMSSHAQAPAPSDNPAKIAVIAFQGAVAQTNEFQRNLAALQKKYDPKRQQLKTMGDEIDSLTKQLQATDVKLTDSERAAKAKSLDDKKKQAQRLAEDAQNDYQQEVQQIFNATATKVGDVLIDYAKRQGYTLVLDGGEQQTQVVLYYLPSSDITKPIVDAYNLKSGVPAQPAPSQAVPSAPKPAPKPPATH